MKALLLFPNTLWRFFLNSWRLRVVFVLLLWGSMISVALAQTKVWDKTFGGIKSYADPDFPDDVFVYGESILKVMVAMPDGGYLLVGRSRSDKGGDKSEDNNSKGESDLWIVRIDAAGNKLWDKTLGGGGSEAAVATPDGGFLLGGESFYVVKLDANGNKLWDKDFGSGQLHALSVSPDGGYVLGGTSSSGKGGSDYRVVKINEGSDKEWDKTLGSANPDVLNALAATGDGGYLLGGWTKGENVSGEGSETKRALDDYYVIRIDGSGNKIWERQFGGRSRDQLKDIAATPDGNYLLGGESSSRISGDKSEANKGSGGPDYWIVKIDEDGNKLWDKTYGGESADNLKSVIVTPDNGFLLGGTSSSGVSGDKSEPFHGTSLNFDYWVVKIDDSGSKIWDKTFGGNDHDLLQDVVVSPDGSYLLGGYSQSGIGGDKSEAVKGITDYWVIKIKDKDQAKQDQTITFDLIPIKTSDDAPFALPARASSGLPVSFNVVGPATVADSILTITGYGIVTVRASQTGNEMYSPAPDVSRTFIVEKADSIVIKEWDKAYAFEDKDNLSTMVATPDGGYLLGVTDNDTGGNKINGRFLVIKIDAGGNKVWERTYENEGYDRLSAIVATGDGGYLLGGASEPASLQGEPKKNDADYWLVKIDADGTQLWDKTFGGSGDDELYSLLVTADGGYLLGGSSTSGISGDKTEASRGITDYWIIKTDKNGNKLWNKTFGGNSADILKAMVVTADGGYLLGGSSASAVGGDKTDDGLSDVGYWIVKIDGNGNKIWDKDFDGLIGARLGAMLVTPDGGYLLGGTAYSEKYSAERQGSDDYWIQKIDANGNRVWDEYFSGDGLEELSDMLVTADGGYLLGGSSESYISGDVTKADRGGYDYWIVKIDASGKQVWDKRFGGDNDDALGKMLATADGYLLGGTSLSGISGDKTEPDAPAFWIVKVKDTSISPAPVAPVLTAFSPRAALPGAAITLTGAHLLATTAVRFNGEAATFTVLSDSSLTAIIPLTAVSGEIEVETAAGKAASTDNFLVLQPSIVVFAPSRGYAGAPVLLYGRHLATTSQVRFNGVPAQNITIYNDFFILARVPEGATSGKISLTLKGGAEATSSWTYKVLQRTAAQVIAATEAANALAAQPTGPYPNPFTGSVTIPVLLAQPSPVRLLIYTAAGQQVSEVALGELQAGAHQLQWNGTDSQGRKVKPGLYTYQLITNNTQTSGKLLKTEAR